MGDKVFSTNASYSILSPSICQIQKKGNEPKPFETPPIAENEVPMAETPQDNERPSAPTAEQTVRKSVYA